MDRIYRIKIETEIFFYLILFILYILSKYFLGV